MGDWILNFFVGVARCHLHWCQVEQPINWDFPEEEPSLPGEDEAEEVLAASGYWLMVKDAYDAGKRYDATTRQWV